MDVNNDVRKSIRKQISRQLSRKMSVSEPMKDKEVLKTGKWKLWLRLMKLNMPELPVLVFGLIMAILFAAANPLFAKVFGDMMTVLSEPDTVKARKDSEITALNLAGVGLGFFLTVGIQVPELNRSLRTLTYFSRESHSPGLVQN